MQALILERLESAGLAVSGDESARLAAFLDLLLRWNRVHNLTAVVEPEEMIRRHLLESLAMRGHLRGQRIADVGSGAGLPGIPLAIVEPGRHFTLIESRSKRAHFLSHVRGALALANVDVEQARAEDLRGMAPFATVLARAVAPLPELVELTEHLLGDDGRLLVLTKADLAQATSGLDGYRVRRLDDGGLLEGSLIAVERKH
ncbi:MAG TPA: 16S rRNA (guanine(527)-N(7))-methyltransferase RsmG [Gammaproteobacteria bacterium]|nr:16S rRNA (guanine(527)-N(7))-methyltransferase RsmG [Gammaproteobacteria bacterium]